MAVYVSFSLSESLFQIFHAAGASVYQSWNTRWSTDVSKYHDQIIKLVLLLSSFRSSRLILQNFTSFVMGLLPFRLWSTRVYSYLMMVQSLSHQMDRYISKPNEQTFTRLLRSAFLFNDQNFACDQNLTNRSSCWFCTAQSQNCIFKLERRFHSELRCISLQHLCCCVQLYDVMFNTLSIQHFVFLCSTLLFHFPSDDLGIKNI